VNLFLDFLDNFGLAVAGAYGQEAAEEVQVLIIFVIIDIDPFTSLNRQRGEIIIHDTGE
jgi:hypothetical protein